MATTSSASATLDAFLAGGRVKHHRLHDHIGAESDLYVAIDSPIGSWEAGTPIHYVIEDLYLRVLELQYGPRVSYSFTADSFIGWWFSLDSLLIGTISKSFIVEAQLGKGGLWTIESLLCGGAWFSLDAIVIR